MEADDVDDDGGSQTRSVGVNEALQTLELLIIWLEQQEGQHRAIKHPESARHLLALFNN